MKKTQLMMKIRSGFFVIPLVLMAVFFSRCQDEKISKSTYNPAKDIVCNQFLPDSGGVGTKLIIIGENFGSDTSLIKVTVNNKIARVIGVNDTRIYAVVPSRADTGMVSLTIGKGETAQSFTFPRKFIYQFKQNVTTLSGKTKDSGEGDVVDGTLAEAWFNTPVWLALDNDNTIFVLEEYRGVRAISIRDGKVTTPMRIGGAISRPRTIDFSLSQDTLYLTNDQGSNDGAGVSIMTRNNGFMNPKTYAQSSQTNAAIVNPVDGEVFFNRYGDGMIFRYNKTTGKGEEQFRLDENEMELSFCFTKDGKTLYIICRNRHYIFKADYDFKTKKISNPRTFIGKKGTAGNLEGLGLEARINQPCEAATDYDGNLFVADSENHCIRKITPDGVMTTYAGIAGQAGYVDGEPLKSKFRNPEGLAIDKNGVIYVADKKNHRIRKILIE